MMTVHVLHAGDGYTYLTRQVASADVARERGEDLSAYYLQHGNPPGEWVGAGLAGLDVSGGVDESQMKNLFGEGRHPDAERIEREALASGASVKEADRASQLGRRFARYDPPDDYGYGELLSSLFASFKAENDRDPLPGPERDELRWAAARQVSGRLHEGPVSDAQVAQLLASVGREQRHPVAGYDLVFTPAKSVSTLWALADEPVQAQVADAHRAAWREALAWVEKEAGLTRLGAGGVKQVMPTPLEPGGRETSPGGGERPSPSVEQVSRRGAATPSMPPAPVRTRPRHAGGMRPRSTAQASRSRPSDPCPESGFPSGRCQTWHGRTDAKQ